MILYKIVRKCMRPYPLLAPGLSEVVRDLAALLLPALTAELPGREDRCPLPVAVLHHLLFGNGLVAGGVGPDEAHEAAAGTRLGHSVLEADYLARM